MTGDCHCATGQHWSAGVACSYILGSPCLEKATLHGIPCVFSGFRELEFFGLFEPAQPGTAMVVELASREEVLEVRISGMVGDSFTLRLDASTRGKDVLKMVRAQVTHKPGSRISLVNGANALSLTRSLKEQVPQDLGEEAVELAYVYTKVNVVEAWLYLNGEPVDNEEAADGITRVEGLENESLEQVILPSSLQSPHLATTLTRVWIRWLCPAAYRLSICWEHLTRGLRRLPGQAACRLSNLERSLARVLNRWLCRAACRLSGLVQTITRVWSAWLCQGWDLTFGKGFNHSLGYLTFPSSLKVWW